jgi:hypothetical protein
MNQFYFCGCQCFVASKASYKTDVIIRPGEDQVPALILELDRPLNPTSSTTQLILGISYHHLTVDVADEASPWMGKLLPSLNSKVVL